jgi:hypothetical protein
MFLDTLIISIYATINIWKKTYIPRPRHLEKFIRKKLFLLRFNKTDPSYSSLQSGIAMSQSSSYYVYADLSYINKLLLLKKTFKLRFG